MQTSGATAMLDHCELVNIPFRERLEEPHRHVPYVYFLESGLASLMYKGSGDDTSEVAIVGREGCTGCGLILGIDRSPQGANMQVAGVAQRIPAQDFRLALRDDGVRDILLRYVHTQIIQRDETALAASRGTIHQRMARWLLMAQDRLGSPELPLTHDLLSVMLSVRRAGVTTALQLFKARELVELKRKSIVIADRDGLKRMAVGFYGAPEAEFRRLLASGGYSASV